MTQRESLAFADARRARPADADDAVPLGLRYRPATAVVIL